MIISNKLPLILTCRCRSCCSCRRLHRHGRRYGSRPDVATSACPISTRTLQSSSQRHTLFHWPVTYADTPALPHQGNCSAPHLHRPTHGPELHRIVAVGEHRHHQHALVVPRQGPTNGPLPWCLMPPQARTQGPTHGPMPQRATAVDRHLVPAATSANESHAEALGSLPCHR